MKERRSSDQWAMIEVLAWTLLALAVGLGALIEIRSIRTQEALERIEQRLGASERSGQ